MSFLYPDEMIMTEEIIDINYPTFEVNKRDVHKKRTTIANSNKIPQSIDTMDGELISEPQHYYEINISSKQPNLTYSKLNPSSFSSSYMYLHGVIHNNIANITDNNDSIVGEMIIEHIPKSSFNHKVYTCYLLENIEESYNDLDKLITLTNSNGDEQNIRMNLNNLVYKQKRCIHYISGSNHVFVFLNPISINKQSASYIQNNLAFHTQLFNKFTPEDITMVNLDRSRFYKDKKKNNESFIGSLFDNKNVIEGNTNMQDIYIDCQPVNESDETDTAYLTKIMNSEDGSQDQLMTFYKMATNFLLFIIIAIVCRFSIPTIYKIIILNNVIKGFDIQEEIEYKMYIRIADLILIGIVLFHLFNFWGIGMQENGYPIFIVFFLLLLAVMVFSYSIIQLKKLDAEFMTVDKKGGPISVYYDPDNDNTEEYSISDFYGSFFEKLARPAFRSVPALIFISIIVYFASLIFIPSKVREQLREKNLSFRVLGLLNFTVFTPLIYLSYIGSK